MTDHQLLEKVKSMTLEEKALELTQYAGEAYLSEGEGTVNTGVAVNGGLEREKIWKDGTILGVIGAENVSKVRARRKEKGIGEPVAFMLDVIHGYRTIFPVPLAMACSFDPPLIEDCAELSAIEARYDGIDVTFSPMVDLSRDARWGRVMESGGEDPYWSGEVGKAFIRGYHKGGIGCCVKHFAGYGAGEAGRDYNTTDISERNLKEYYLRSYRACLDEKPELFMSSFNLLNGKPLLGHREITVDTLRTEWGFDGVLISDYAAVEEMKTHGYAETGKECAYIALKSKLGIEMCSCNYALYLPELVAEGIISEEEVDEMVLGVLRLKNGLGLYENPDRYTDPEKRDEVTLTKEGRALVRKAAQESCVLLKNENVLPLEKNVNAAFVGPFVEEKAIYGKWACMGRAEDCVSIKEGVERLLGKKIQTARGCSNYLLETDESEIKSAVELALKSDVIVACIGEHMEYTGEAHSRADITLPAVQKKLVARLHELQKPLVLVIFGGRPQALSDIEQYADAILYVWQPGTEGGNAIADLLYGDAVPSGKTAMSFPRSTGQCPIYYNCFSTGRPKSDDAPTLINGQGYTSGYDDEYNSPLYPFGYGLSYTAFEYSGFKLSATQMKRGGKIIASVKVKNIGKYAGKEVVQWYLHDCFASVVRPVKELKGYEKIYLKPNEEKVVTFEITEDVLKFYTESDDFAAETGKFKFFVGGNSRDCQSAAFELSE